MNKLSSGQVQTLPLNVRALRYKYLKGVSRKIFDGDYQDILQWHVMKDSGLSENDSFEKIRDYLITRLLADGATAHEVALILDMDVADIYAVWDGVSQVEKDKTIKTP